MSQYDFAKRYSTMSDVELRFLSEDRTALVDEAVTALEKELTMRGLPLNFSPVRSARVIETPGGVVVTVKQIAVPLVCVGCLKTNSLVGVPIPSPITEVQYRIIYTKTVTHSYKFLFCPDCAVKPIGVGPGECGMQISRMPTGKYDLFQFANDEYMRHFLKANI